MMDTVHLARRRAFLAACAACIGATTTSTARAQAYPAKPVRILVPFAAGGATDSVGRLVAQKLAATWPQPALVENPVGAGGVIGTQQLARTQPDGHTLMLVTINHAINASLVRKLPYDSIKDFSFISHLMSIPNVLVVHPSLPINSVKELLDYARANPGKLIFASSGNGTSQHLSGEMLRMLTGVDFLHVPYKGTAPAVSDLLGGHVSFMFDNPLSVAGHIRTGGVRALAVTSATRNAAYPDLPAIAESVPGFDVRSWFGLMGPAGIPKPIQDILHAEMVRIFALPDVKEKLAQLGGEAQVTSPASFTAYATQEVERWAKVVKASGAKVD